jgi:hypothetical protein
MRPTDVCTPKHLTRALVLRRFPVQLPCARRLSTPSALVPRLAPRARSRDVASRAVPPSGDEGPGTEGLGATRCKRDRGGSRFTTRSSLRRPCRFVARGMIAPRAGPSEAVPDIPVASSAPLPFDRGAIAAWARRPPRPVPRGPRERRALPRSEMSSIVRFLAATARTEARTACNDFIGNRRSRDEDRRTPMKRLPFASHGPCACARGVPLVARLPSTRLLPRTGFQPARCRGRVSLSPKTT